MCETIEDLLKLKGSEVYTVQADATLEDTIRLMAEKRIGFVPIMEGENIVGLYSDRDFTRLLTFYEDISLNTPIREVMVSPVYFIKSEQTIDEGMAVMNAMHFRHLPVLEGKKLIGVISIGDIIKQAMLEKNYTIEQLENILWANLV